MAANTQPIFSNQGILKWGAAITAANTATDGTGTVTTLVLGSTNGNFIQKILVKPLGTNVVTVARIFANNGSSSSIPANNALIAEVTLPATTLSQTAAMTGVEIPLNLVLPVGYYINVALGTAVAAGWMFSAVGGQY